MTAISSQSCMASRTFQPLAILLMCGSDFLGLPLESKRSTFGFPSAGAKWHL